MINPNPKLSLSVGLSGYFKLETFRVDESGNELPGSRRPRGEFKNLITNNGLNLIGGSGGSLMQYCQVGSGNSTPLFTDTALQSKVAHATTLSTTEGFVASAFPYYGWKKWVYQFATGVAAGNLSEIGVSPATTGNLFSRALILDGLGNPTTITILSDEILEVTYELRTYAPTDDVVKTDLVLNSITYTVTARPIGFSASGASGWGRLNTPLSFSGGGSGEAYALNDAIGPQTEAMFNGPGTIAFIGSYVANSYYRDFRLSLSLSEGNFAGGSPGLGRIHLDTNMASYQYAFTPKVPKTSSYTFSLDVRLSWARV